MVLVGVAPQRWVRWFCVREGEGEETLRKLC